MEPRTWTEYPRTQVTTQRWKGERCEDHTFFRGWHTTAALTDPSAAMTSVGPSQAPCPPSYSGLALRPGRCPGEPPVGGHMDPAAVGRAGQLDGAGIGDPADSRRSSDAREGAADRAGGQRRGAGDGSTSCDGQNGDRVVPVWFTRARRANTFLTPPSGHRRRRRLRLPRASGHQAEEPAALGRLHLGHRHQGRSR